MVCGFGWHTRPVLTMAWICCEPVSSLYFSTRQSTKQTAAGHKLLRTNSQRQRYSSIDIIPNSATSEQDQLSGATATCRLNRKAQRNCSIHSQGRAAFLAL